MTRCAPLALILLLAAALAGCASHSDRTRDIRSALDAGQPQKALGYINEQLEVDSEKQLPEKTGGDNSLLLLDRAMILQQLERYELASRDLQVADKQIEILDLSRNAAHDVGKYLFSDDSGPYRAPAYEKLLVNTMNVLNYLVRGDLNGARIESRRLAVMQRYLTEHQSEAQSLSGPGSYLAGFTFEKSGQTEQALRYYDEALSQSAYPSLSEPIQRLLARSGYRTARLKQSAERAGASAKPPESDEDAEILVVISFGRVPPKLAKRVPIGLALTYASDVLSPGDVQRANYLAAQGLVTWVNYPELGRARGSYDRPGFALDGRWMSTDAALAIDQQARQAWDGARGTVIAGAITRMLTRVVAGQAVRKTANEGVLGALLSLGVQASLTAADTPDTRSWSTLPARMAIGRMRVAPGTHYVSVQARGVQRRRRVDLKPGDWAVVAHTVLF